MTKPPGINPVIFLLPFAVLVIFVYLPTSSSFFHIWTSSENPNYSHGLLLLGISVFFIFREIKTGNEALVTMPFIPATAGLAIISLVWLIAFIGNIQIIQLVCMLFIFILLFFSLLGLYQARRFLPALVLNIFSIPVWDILNPTLRKISTVGVSKLLGLVNILHVTEGYKITIRPGSFLVDIGCSGLGQLIAAMAIGYIYGFMQPFTWRVRALLIFFAAVTAIITNIIRIFIVVVSGYMTDMKSYFVTVDHVKLGWFVFAVGISCYFYAVNRVFGAGMPAETSATETDRADLPRSYMVSRRRLYLALALTTVAIASGPLLSLFYTESNQHIAVAKRELPSGMGAWHRVEPDPGRFLLAPKYNGMDSHIRADYENPGQETVEIHEINYVRQSQGKEAINDLNRSYQEHQWQVLRHEIVNVSPNAPGFNAEETLIEADDGRVLLVWKWYALQGFWTADTYKARLKNIWGILTGKPEISVIITAKEAGSNYQAEHNLMQDFALSLRDKLIKSR